MWLAEPESSDSESLPPSDQSSDWRSSEDDDKPAKKRPKKKRKASRPSSRVPQQSHHYHHQSHGRERMGSHNEPPVNNRNIMGRGGIFDDEPGFGGSFGGGMDPMRSQSQRNPGSLSREQMQVRYATFIQYPDVNFHFFYIHLMKGSWLLQAIFSFGNGNAPFVAKYCWHLASSYWYQVCLLQPVRIALPPAIPTAHSCQVLQLSVFRSQISSLLIA